MRALIAACLLASPLFAFPPAFAQETLPRTTPRTSDGKPDLQGYWLSGFLTRMQRPDGVANLIVPPAEADALIAKLKADLDEGEVYDPELDYNTVPLALLNINGELRSSWLVEPENGKLPLTALARAAIKSVEDGFDNPESRPQPERCINGLVNAPIAASSLMLPMQLVQTRDNVVIVMEDMDPARIVTLSNDPRPDALRTRGGHSRGRWEGDTLVVETDRFIIPDRAGLTWSGGAYLTNDSKVIERFSLTAPDMLLYQFTVEDPSLYTAPWRAEYVLKRIPRPVYEYACHEGNHALIHILLAARLGRQETKPAP